MSTNNRVVADIWLWTVSWTLTCEMIQIRNFYCFVYRQHIYMTWEMRGDCLATSLIMLGFMDLGWPRVCRHPTSVLLSCVVPWHYWNRCWRILHLTLRNKHIWQEIFLEIFTLPFKQTHLTFCKIFRFHYGIVTWKRSPHYCLFARGISSGFLSQRASNTESISMLWPYHECTTC